MQRLIELSNLYFSLPTPNTLYSYLYYLKKANLIEIIGGNFKGKKLLNKPDKIYLDNINPYSVLCDRKNDGSPGESFFVSQIKQQHAIQYSSCGDFKVDDAYLFEIGLDNRIPLWLFGFLY